MEDMQKDRISKDDQTLKAPAVPKRKKGKRLPGVKGKAFTCKDAGDALAGG